MTLEEEIIELISKDFSIEKNKLKRDASLINDLQMDSLDLTELTMKIEEKYKINSSNEDLEKLRTVGDIIDYASKHCKGPPDEAGYAVLK